MIKNEDYEQFDKIDQKFLSIIDRGYGYEDIGRKVKLGMVPSTDVSDFIIHYIMTKHGSIESLKEWLKMSRKN